MLVKLITECLIVNHQRNPFIVSIDIPGVQVCYLERYFQTLEGIAKTHNSERIEVVCHGYVHRGIVKDGKIKMERN